MEEKNIDLFATTEEETLVESGNQAEQLVENEESESEVGQDNGTAEESEESEAESKAEKLNPYAEAILAEMNRRVAQGDELLATALQSNDKSIKECCEYMEYRAKKWAEEQKISGNVCVWLSDADGYAIAHHYYIESKETIDAELHPKPKELPKTASKSASKGATKKEEKKIHKNPLLEAIAKQGEKKAEQSKSDKPKITVTKDGVKIEIAKNGERTTSIERNGQTYTMTEFSLF